VIRYLYDGRLMLTPANAAPVLDAAARLRVGALADAARGYLRRALGPGTAAALLGEALRYELDDLADECVAAILRE
jgi:hypothetical protein